MRTVSLILLLTASARALLKPSPTARTMASRCLRAFFDSSLILPGPASRRAAQPGVEQRGRRGRARRLEHVAQALLEQAGPVEPLVLAGDPPEVERLPLREALRVLEQG